MLVLFVLVLARVMGLLTAFPGFSRASMPARVRVSLGIFIAVALAPVIGRPELPVDGAAAAGAMATEFMTGFAIGLFARLLIAAFHLAGTLMSFQAGFAMARAFNPETDTQATVLETIHINLVTAIFLILDGHHLLLRSLAASFETFPVASTFQSEFFARSLFTSAASMFEMGAQIAAPVTGLLLLINATIGLLNRIMPQFSIFNIGFPLQVAGGILAVLISLPGTASFFLGAYESLEAQLGLVFSG